MTPELLRAAGEALYGASWRAPLARDLCVSDRTIQRWLKAESPIPHDLWLGVATLCHDRGRTLQQVEDDLCEEAYSAVDRRSP